MRASRLLVGLNGGGGAFSMDFFVVVFEVVFLARFFCGSAVDAASDFLFDDAVLLFDLVRLLLALLRSV